MILDLFAGPGGWDEGLRLVGRDDVIGVEWDKDACATAQAAGHQRVLADITTLDTRQFGDLDGLIASPPCQTFSDAGQREGVASLADLADALHLIADGASCEQAIRQVGLDGDARSWLILQPLRFIRDLQPPWIALEEVPPALPVWQTYAMILRYLGYATWAGVLNAADYGVPQARKRAFLLATREGTPAPPMPTHAKTEQLTLFATLPAWVTMAAALGWTAADCIAANALAPEPARDSQRCLWPLSRPATTIVRSFRPDIVAAPGYRQSGDGPRQNQPGSLYVTPAQMCVLQGIRSDYPFSGSQAKRLSLIGAILPPPWAAAILGALVSQQTVACRECGNDDALTGHLYCPECIGIAA